ncbi:EpsG family protein [Pseudomonas sp. NPDC007930]|uniref:EpsG family protein n=1 Tax=Pseudomonas sp. NPDC007930 TaxID=3364417 RepID=UPI0036EA670E
MLRPAEIRFNLAQIGAVAAVMIIVCVYYIVGGYHFPDYTNYITIVKNGGVLRDSSEYVAEWFSRGFFKLVPAKLDIEPRATVDLFVAIVQAAFLIFVTWASRGSPRLARGWVFLTLALGPLLLTTAVRSAPAYLCIAYLGCDENLKKRPWFKFLILAVVAVSFHDTAIVMLGLLAVTVLLAKVQSRLLDWLIAGVLFLVPVVLFFSQLITNFLLPIIVAHVHAGSSIYLATNPTGSIIKRFFMLFIWWCVFSTWRADQVSRRTKIFLIASLALAVSAYLINEVAGIRFSLFCLGVAVVARGAFLVTGDESKATPLLMRLDLIAAIIYGFLIYADVLRQGGAQ